MANYTFKLTQKAKPRVLHDSYIFANYLRKLLQYPYLFTVLHFNGMIKTNTISLCFIGIFKNRKIYNYHLFMRLSLPFLTDSILLLVQTDYANLILYIFA